jgi:hypothetical protein
MYLIKILIAVVVISSVTLPQLNDTTYSLSTEIGFGYSRYFTTMDYDNLNQNGFSGTVRVMWNPEHLLSLGLETGYQNLYSLDVSDYDTEFGITNVKAAMYAIPVFIIFSMKVLPNIKLSAGSGVNLLFNSGELFGDELSSSQSSIGAHLGISYTYPVNNSMAIGGELLYSYFSKLQDQTIAIQFLFVYDFLQW